MDMFEFVNDPDKGEEFVSADDIQALNDEAEVLNKTHKEMAEKLFDEHVVRAVLTVAKLCDVAKSDNIRFGAAKYIIERVLGPLGQKESEATVDNILDNIKKAGEKVTFG